MFVGIKFGTYSIISRRIDSAQSVAQIIIMVIVVVIVHNNPLLLVLIHQTFILLTSLERPQYFSWSPFPPHPGLCSDWRPIQSSQWNQTSVQNRNCTGSCRCATRPCPGHNHDRPSSLRLLPPPPSFFVSGDGFCDMGTFCTRGYREAIQSEEICLENPRPSEN